MGQRSSPHCLHEGTGPTENIAFSPGNLSASCLNWAAFGRPQRAARKKIVIFVPRTQHLRPLPHSSVMLTKKSKTLWQISRPRFPTLP